MNAIEFIKEAQSGRPDYRGEASAAMEAARRQPDPAVARARHELLAIANRRIEGREFSARKPPVAMNLRIGDQGAVAAQLKPTVINSPSGWAATGLSMKIDVGRRTLHLDVLEDGSLRGKRWTLDVAPELLEVARQLLRLFDRGVAFVLASLNQSSCLACAKALTDPQSRAHGIGPECMRHFMVKHSPLPPKEQTDALSAEVARLRRAIQDQHPDRNPDADPHEIRELIKALTAVKAKLDAAQRFN
jgi:hypothetical protein